ncbi:MAG TPA: hypothetical protein VGT78_09445 [Rhizomicrobium sp.]|nr:hypothetical protein [Rhizomicrobium sp.]
MPNPQCRMHGMLRAMNRAIFVIVAFSGLAANATKAHAVIITRGVNDDSGLAGTMQNLQQPYYAGFEAAMDMAFQNTTGVLGYEAWQKAHATGATISHDDAVKQMAAEHLRNTNDIPARGLPQSALDIIKARQHQQNLDNYEQRAARLSTVSSIVAAVLGHLPDPINLFLIPLCMLFLRVRKRSVARLGR